MTCTSVDLETDNIFVILVTTPQYDIQELHLCYQTKGVERSYGVRHKVRARWRASVAQASVVMKLFRKSVISPYKVDPLADECCYLAQGDCEPLDREWNYAILTENLILLTDFRKTHRLVQLVIDSFEFARCLFMARRSRVIHYGC